MKTLRPTLWRTCRAIANTTRLRLLWKIFQSEGLCVSELACAAGASRENATIQLRALNARGLITPERRGKKIVYRAKANPGVDGAEEILAALRQCFIEKVPLKSVFRQATAFTHSRRIHLMKTIIASGGDFDELGERSGMSPIALRWNLEKLEGRGFVKLCSDRYEARHPKNPLAECLMKLVCKPEAPGIVQVISGGQTGADRAALDAAIACGVPHGGWCPKGRRAEDGPIDPVYNLEEMATEDYPSRTKANVADSDVTVIFSRGPLSGGSLLTQEFAEELNKPCLHIDFQALENSQLDRAEFFQALEEKVPAVAEAMADEPDLGNIVLNVAGPRASTDPSIYEAVYSALTRLLR